MSSIRNGKPREMYKINRKQKTSGDKLKNTQKTIERIEKRIKKEGASKVTTDELAKANAKLKKYGFKA
ncbi:MAG: hypothetical protein PHU71_05780 [Candidatus Gracilibacteria bacterium]|nr:hypothetical protein [Candidatus Gracilibacteria bacterium]